jgi:hypothetical protein
VNHTLQDIERGFHVEEPNVFVPWGIAEADLLRMLGPQANRVTVGYVTRACRSLGGLSCQIGFHLTPRGGGVLTELEFFRQKYPDERASFGEFQSHLVTAFGPPHSTEPGILEYPDCNWQFGTVSVGHFMVHRYMAEEHVRIVNSSAPLPASP